VQREREFFIENLLVQIHLIIVMIRWTGLAPWEFEFPFPGSLASTFLSVQRSWPRGQIKADVNGSGASRQLSPTCIVPTARFSAHAVSPSQSTGLRG